MAVAIHRHPLSSLSLSGSPAPLRVVRSPVVFLVATPRWPPAAALPVWTFCGAQYLGKTATLVPSRWSFARRLMLDTVELIWTSVKRVGTRRIYPHWCRREHATTGADQTPGPFLVSRHPLSEGRPLLAVSGSSWGPVRCVVAISLDSVWSSAIAGHRGPGPVRASVHLSRVLVEAGVTPAVHLHGPAPLATPHHYP